MENSAKICFNRRYIAVKEMNTMGRFVNPGNSAFKVALASEIYIDKTGLLDFTNSVLGTKQAYICNSRPRRFGKSITADMLTAYYSKGCDSRELFMNYNIAQTEYFEKYLNKYDVIHLDMQWILIDAGAPERISGYINKNVISELADLYKDIDLRDQKTLYGALSVINSMTNNKFVIIIDEWDVLIRDEAANSSVQEEYINFLRGMFKGSEPTKYIELAFLTGILPIKKPKTQSALNNFEEFTMISPGGFAHYIGFTEDEVKKLCITYDMDFESIKAWYNGYLIDGLHMYNPNSVVQAMLDHDYDFYWKNTSSFESINTFITMNYAGLKDDVLAMLSGDKIRVNVNTFQNDLTTVASKDDALTALIHLGYLAYDANKKMAYIPNYEVAAAYDLALQTGSWSEVANSISKCDELLDATLNEDADKVAELVEIAHETYTSVLKYNDENSLSCVLTMAYFTANAYYNIVREFPAGKGFADLVFIPRANACGRPAIVIELKYNASADSAISQIKNRRYHGALSGYSNQILLVGINYSNTSDNKKHTCIIESINNLD